MAAGIGELARRLSEKKGVPQSEAEKELGEVAEVLAESLADGDGFVFKGLFSVKPVLRKGRRGVIAFGENAGSEWETKDHYSLSARAGKELDAALNG